MPINTLLKGYLKDFNGFSDKEIELINENSYFRTMKQGSTMMECGTICTDVLFLTHCKIRIYKILPDGKEITLYRIHNGEMCVVPVNNFSFADE